MASGGNPNEPKSVSMILKQRQQSRSGGGGGGGRGGAGGRGGGGGRGGYKNATNPPNVNDNLNPILPPLYPTATAATPLRPEVIHYVQVYDKLASYFRSNYSVPVETKNESGFYLDRYTDQYQSALALKPHLLHKLPDSRFPEDLTRKHVKLTVTRRMKRKIEDLPDKDEDVEREGSPEKAAANPAEEGDEEEKDEDKEEKNFDDMDDMEEDLDEEMDMGTDYALSYFDNGEGDEDDRDDDDGPTYS